MEVKAKLNYFQMSPRKVRMVAKIIKGLDVLRAERELLFRNKKGARAILKLLRSAINNALQKGLNKEDLFVKNIIVNEGPKNKRYYPKARGQVGLITKKTSHIEITLVTK
ncbi:MAG: 50S ribosomal protein L22 [Patescibacteria group bacterium]